MSRGIGICFLCLTEGEAEIRNRAWSRALISEMLVGALVLALAGAAAAGPPTVTTPDGPLFGFTANGTDAFRGIPFAAPPTGNNRFRPPQPVSPWTDPLNATRFGPSCLQIGSPRTTEGKAWNTLNLNRSSEDCLTLNVYRPSSSSTQVSSSVGSTTSSSCCTVPAPLQYSTRRTLGAGL